VLFVGLAKGALPFKGGLLHMNGVPLTVNIAVGGAPGVAGAGGATLPVVLPNLGTLTGTSIYLQGAFADPAAVQDVSLSNGLEMEIG
jgi:hypothetical protein